MSNEAEDQTMVKPTYRFVILLGPGSCEHGSELSGYIKGREFADGAERLSASQETFCSTELL
jgi:hypothetical protein